MTELPVAERWVQAKEGRLRHTDPENRKFGDTDGVAGRLYAAYWWNLYRVLMPPGIHNKDEL